MRASVLARARSRAADVAALLRFLSRRRSVWLALLVAALLAIALFLYLAQSAAVAPYVYPLL